MEKSDSGFDFFEHNIVLQIAAALNIKIVGRRFCGAVRSKRLLFFRRKLELHRGSNALEDLILQTEWVGSIRSDCAATYLMVRSRVHQSIIHSDAASRSLNIENKNEADAKFLASGVDGDRPPFERQVHGDDHQRMVCREVTKARVESICKSAVKGRLRGIAAGDRREHAQQNLRRDGGSGVEFPKFLRRNRESNYASENRDRKDNVNGTYFAPRCRLWLRNAFFY